MEFFRRALDYPRKDLFDPKNPRFENIVNSTIAEAMGGGRHLPTEPFYHIPIRKIKQPIGPVQEPGKLRGQAKTSQSTKWSERPSGRYARFRTSRKPTSPSDKPNPGPVIQNQRLAGTKTPEPKTSLGKEAVPLDGDNTCYKDGPFTDPSQQISPEACCFCWNAGIPCKYLDTDGVTCRKVHVCSLGSCRTLYHHGHRKIDHPTKSS